MSNSKTQPKIDRDLEKLAPWFVSRLNLALSHCQGLGFRVAMFEGFRTPERQQWIYEQGRTRKGRIVTNAKAWESWHCFGLAADIAYRTPDGKWTWDGDFHRLSPIFQQYGLNWFGPGDAGHYDQPGRLTLRRAKELYDAGGFPAVWEEALKTAARQSPQAAGSRSLS